MSIETLSDILALRGRVVVFTASAPVGLQCERLAERYHATVICTRGWADRLAPLALWQRLHVNREPGLLSCNQHTYVTGLRIPATDLVWVGSDGVSEGEIGLTARYQQAMGRADHLEEMGLHVRKWRLNEDQV